MHEFQIIANIFPILEQTIQEHQLIKVNQVTLEIGELRQCQNDFLEFAFATLTKDTLAKDAMLLIKTIPIKMLCTNCRQEFIVAKQTFICPECNSSNLQLLAGKELILANIEGEKR